MNRIIIVLALALSAPLFGQPTKQWSQGNPSSDEQFALEVINHVRRDPVAAANFYIGESGAKPIVAGAVSTQFTRDSNNLQVTGAPAVKLLAAADLANYNGNLTTPRTAPPKPPLVLYPAFTEEAKSREADVLSAASSRGINLFSTSGASLPGTPVTPLAFVLTPTNPEATPSFSGSNATGGTATVKAGGLTQTGAFDRSELLFSVNYYDPLITLRESFLMRGASYQTWLDDSYSTTRTGFGSAATFTYGKTKMVGVNLSAARTSAPGVGARVLTVYATDNEAFSTSDLPFGVDTVFVTGVVYRDNDKDGDYTPGEGLGGVTITPSSGAWYAVTSASGGFAIPFNKNAGAITLTATGNGVNTSNVVTVGADNVKLDFALSTGSKPVQVTVGGSDGTNQFVNLSTRGVAEPGETALIGGFVISGTGTKTVLIRGVAQSLLNFGLSGVLRKPVLTLFDDKSQPIKVAHTQDTYGPDGKVKSSIAAVATNVGAFAMSVSTFAGAPDGIRPAGDAALVTDLKPGLYSVSIAPDSDTPSPTFDSPAAPGGTGTSGSSGLVLLEIYDATPNSGARFINLSTRGKIETGARQMIVGFVIGGTGHRQLLVRGIGPALKGFGITTALDDSALQLFDSNSAVLAVNDDWGLATWTDQTVNVSQAVGAFALADSSRDAVILTRVAPGLYSAGVTSVTGQIGVGLAEIYEGP